MAMCRGRTVARREGTAASGLLGTNWYRLAKRLHSGTICPIEVAPPGSRSVRYAPPIEILILCTANLCRSPIAEVIFATQVAQRDIEARIRSAGFLDTGRPTPSEVATALERAGLNFPGHASRVVSDAELVAADLVLCMERAHVREAVVRNAAAWPKSFTVKEFIRRGADAGARSAAESAATYLARLGVERDRSELLGASDSDDIADPYGKKLPAYEATTNELSHLVARVIELLWPTSPVESS